MRSRLRCPHCGQFTVQMIEHEPLPMKKMPHEKHLFGKFQCLQLGCLNIFHSVLDIEFKEVKYSNNNMIDEINAKNILRESGYYVDDLWCVDYVIQQYDITSTEAMRLLSDVLSNDETYQYIWDQIDLHAKKNNYKNQL
jgi:hypothetical protein